MDSTSCYRVSDNIYLNMPPRMDDGRHFTDYRNNNHVHSFRISQIRNKNPGVNNSYSVRQYFINNGEDIISSHRKFINCRNRSDQNKTISSPHLTELECDKFKCTHKNINNKGLGHGYLNQLLPKLSKSNDIDDLSCQGRLSICNKASGVQPFDPYKNIEEKLL